MAWWNPLDWFGDTESGLGGDGLGGGLVDVALSAGDYIDNEWGGSPPSVQAQPVRSVMPSPTFAAMPALLPSGMVTRGLARFPSLLGALQSWRGRGVSLTAEKLLSMVRKYGPNFLVTAGILTVAAVSELLMYGATRKRRRMNALNPRALSRATRRLCSFDRRASKVKATLGSLVGRSVGRRRGGRCSTCRKSPCRC